MDRYVVVGASLAGLRAVEAARRAGYQGGVTLIGAEPHLPYDRPPLSKEFLDETSPGTSPSPGTEFRDEPYLTERLGITLRLGEAATGLDTDAREVLVGDARVPYDAVLIATGAHARTLPGTETLPGVHALRTVEDARAIRLALDAGARTVVIGAGFIGSEIAASARKRGLEVTVVEALPTPLVRAVGEELGAALAHLHVRHGTGLRCGVGVAEVLGTDRVSGVRLTDGTQLDADLVVAGIGAIPTTDWLAGSGLRIENGVVCDEYLRAGPPGVYAAGDVARWRNPLFDRLQRLEHWTSAADQGAAAARNAIDESNATPLSCVPYFWSDWYDAHIQFVGIPDADEACVVDGEVSSDRRWVALYRRGERVVGALAVNAPADINKYRKLIAAGGSWPDALELAEQRRAAFAAKAAAAQPG